MSIFRSVTPRGGEWPSSLAKRGRGTAPNARWTPRGGGPLISSLAFRGGGGLSLDHCRRHSHDGIGHLINPTHHFAGRDPHHRHAAFLEPRVAARVALRAITQVVTYAVDLDRQPRLRAIEIEHIGSNRDAGGETPAILERACAVGSTVAAQAAIARGEGAVRWRWFPAARPCSCHAPRRRSQ